MIPRALALDLSLTATGVASWDALRDPPVQVHTISPTGRAAKGQQRIWYLRTAIAQTCDPKPDLVVVESLPMVHGTGDTPLRMAELHGVIKHQLWTSRIEYVLMRPSEVKQYAVGKGSGPGTGKDAVLLAVERRWGHLVKVTTNHEADALTMLAACLDHYGQPLPTARGYRKRLSKVDWPALQGIPVSGGVTLTPPPGAGEAHTLLGAPQ